MITSLLKIILIILTIYTKIIFNIILVYKPHICNYQMRRLAEPMDVNPSAITVIMDKDRRTRCSNLELDIRRGRADEPDLPLYLSIQLTLTGIETVGCYPFVI